MQELREEKQVSGQEAKEGQNPPAKKRYLKDVVSWILYVAFLVAMVYLVNTFVTQRTMVSGNSMYPYLHDGDQLMMDKISYRFKDPERFDIVVLRVDDGTKKGELYIKRIIGLPGESVQITDGKIYINGEQLEETYGEEEIQNGGRAVEGVTLGEDEYFVLGDNRNNSDDSRYDTVGNLKRERIVGKAFVRLWPFDRIAILKHQ